MSTLTNPVSVHFLKALRYASEIHATQARKGPQIPYISHLIAVAGIIGKKAETKTRPSRDCYTTVRRIKGAWSASLTFVSGSVTELATLWSIAAIHSRRRSRHGPSGSGRMPRTSVTLTRQR